MDKKLEKIIDLKLDASDRDAERHGLIQYNYGQILRIHGLDLPPAVEIQFSYREKGGTTENRIGTTKDGITEVQIPDKMLKNNGTTQDYAIWVFVYVTDETSGNTVYRIKLYVDSRPAPGEIGEDPEEKRILDEAVEMVNQAADRAEAAERGASDQAAAAEQSKTDAAESAETAKKYLAETEEVKEETVKELTELSESVKTVIADGEESIAEKQTLAEKSITDHTDTEIARLDRETQASEERLTETIRTANNTAEAVENTASEARRAKESLDASVQNATEEKEAVAAATRTANTAKKNLDQSTADANVAKTALDKTIQSADDQNTSLGEKIETSKQLKTDLQTAGEKATQDIQTAGSEQLGKMQAVAEEFTADREQIATNKEDIGSLKEDIVDLQDKKITKFYASNQGENHLVDSDNGKIQDMMICGNSNQNQTKGKNLLKYPYVETTKTSQGITFTDNKDGSINVSGTATETAYYNLYSNSDGKRLTLASGTYKLITKGRSKCNVFTNNGVNSAKNEGTFTITDGHNDVWCFIEVPKGLKVDETIYPMIQLASSTDDSYEPYTGGIPSPSPDYPQEIKSVVNPTVKVCGKNLLQSNLKYRDIEKINIQKGTRLTLICKNGVVSHGGNLRFKTADGNIEWFGFDANAVKAKTVLQHNVVSFEYLFSYEPSESYALYIGNENTYEPYKEQSVQFTYTLNAIPVSSGGNVTIDGKQYIADRVVEKDGVFGIERNIREIHTNTKTMNNSEEYPGWNLVEGIADATYYNEQVTGSSRMLNFISNITRSTLRQNNIKNYNIVFWIRDNIGYSQSELIAKAIDVDIYIRLQDAIFEPLPGDIQAKLRTLVTNYPVTNISVTSDQLDGYTVFNYPISLANGWNYVKQQLGDTREYIYDMQTQLSDTEYETAMAYVNSEYAVALAELDNM